VIVRDLLTRQQAARIERFEAALFSMNWLFKEEPANYAFDALVKDKQTTWSGVKNPVAQKHLRAVRKGDRILYYHTGDEKAVVGIAKALGDAYPDPADQTGRQSVVDVGPVRKLARPVTLKEIKADHAFKDFALVRISRLSVMPVSDAEWSRIVEDMAEEARGAGKAGR
jgi:predicted RNA-binding protein with PUA-like domain